MSAIQGPSYACMYSVYPVKNTRIVCWICYQFCF